MTPIPMQLIELETPDSTLFATHRFVAQRLEHRRLAELVRAGL